MRKILLVDDQVLCREPLAQALKQKGYETICANDGEHALALLREMVRVHKLPDMILLDVDMPAMDGLTVLRIVRRNPGYAHIPVIMLTGEACTRVVAQAAERRIQGYLLKHEMTIDTIIEKIEECLAKSPQRADSGVKRG